MMSIKLLFDLWPLIQFTIFEEEPCQLEEEPCKCPSEEESIHFEKVFLRVYKCNIPGLNFEDVNRSGREMVKKVVCACMFLIKSNTNKEQT